MNMKQEPRIKTHFHKSIRKRCFECLFPFSSRKEVEVEDKNGIFIATEDNLNANTLITTGVDDLSPKPNCTTNHEDEEVECKYYRELTIVSSDDRNDAESNRFHCKYNVHPTVVANKQLTSFVSQPKSIPCKDTYSLQTDYNNNSYEREVEFYNHATWMMYYRIADFRRMKAQQQSIEEEEEATKPVYIQQEEQKEQHRSKIKKNCCKTTVDTTSPTFTIAGTIPTSPQYRTSQSEFVDQSKVLFHIEI